MTNIGHSSVLFRYRKHESKQMKKQAVSEHTKQTLINATGELAAEMEFSNSSTRAVARLANESNGSIHYHYGRRKSALRSNGKRRVQNDADKRDILEIMEDRHNVQSTLISTQYPVSQWHQLINDPTLADAICDRLIHNAYQLPLNGESMRKMLAKME